MKVVNYNIDNSRYKDSNVLFGEKGGASLNAKPLYNMTSTNYAGEEVKYFSSIDAEIYFVNQSYEKYIDDATQIAFTVSQNTLPLYGYNSYVYDDIALGNRLVKGQFAINFTSSGFLFDVLKTLQTVKSIKLDEAGDAEYSYSKAPIWDGRFDIVISYGNYKKGSVGSTASPSTMATLQEVQIIECSQVFDYSGEPIAEIYSFIAKDYKTV